MSMPLAIENSGADARKPLTARIAGQLRTALLRIALVGLVASAACQVIPGDAGSAPATRNAVAEDTNAAPHVGEFSGRYQDGLPIYLFPTIYVFAKRTAD
jgi:hypothetical protein